MIKLCTVFWCLIAFQCVIHEFPALHYKFLMQSTNHRAICIDTCLFMCARINMPWYFPCKCIQKVWICTMCSFVPIQSKITSWCPHKQSQHMYCHNDSIAVELMQFQIPGSYFPIFYHANYEHSSNQIRWTLNLVYCIRKVCVTMHIMNSGHLRPCRDTIVVQDLITVQKTDALSNGAHINAFQ